jgi:hypothetical protein
MLRENQSDGPACPDRDDSIKYDGKRGLYAARHTRTYRCDFRVGMGVAFLAITALALIFCKMSELFPRNGGIIASITASFGPFVGLQMTLFYWLSTWIGNCALLLAGVGYLSYFFPALHNPSTAPALVLSCYGSLSCGD